MPAVNVIGKFRRRAYRHHMLAIGIHASLYDNAARKPCPERIGVGGQVQVPWHDKEIRHRIVERGRTHARCSHRSDYFCQRSHLGLGNCGSGGQRRDDSQINRDGRRNGPGVVKEAGQGRSRADAEVGDRLPGA